MLQPEEAPKSRMTTRSKAWCLICFALGVLFTNYPLLQIFNKPETLCGIPLMLAYLLGVWLLAIVVLFILTRSLAQSSDKE